MKRPLFIPLILISGILMLFLSVPLKASQENPASNPVEKTIRYSHFYEIRAFDSLPDQSFNVYFKEGNTTDTLSGNKTISAKYPEENKYVLHYYEKNTGNNLWNLAMVYEVHYKGDTLLNYGFVYTEDSVKELRHEENVVFSGEHVVAYEYNEYYNGIKKGKEKYTYAYDNLGQLTRQSNFGWDHTLQLWFENYREIIVHSSYNDLDMVTKWYKFRRTINDILTFTYKYENYLDHEGNRHKKVTNKWSEEDNDFVMVDSFSIVYHPNMLPKFYFYYKVNSGVKSLGRIGVYIYSEDSLNVELTHTDLVTPINNYRTETQYNKYNKKRYSYTFKYDTDISDFYPFSKSQWYYDEKQQDTASFSDSWSVEKGGWKSISKSYRKYRDNGTLREESAYSWNDDLKFWKGSAKYEYLWDTLETSVVNTVDLYVWGDEANTWYLYNRESDYYHIKRGVDTTREDEINDSTELSSVITEKHYSGEKVDIHVFANGSNLKLFNLWSAGTYQVDIIDLAGRKIKDLGTCSVEEDREMRLDISFLAKGLYIVRVGDDHHFYAEKFLK